MARKQITPLNEEQVDERLIPTGATLLNLALSSTPSGGYPIGKVVNLIGDSSSGKTFLALTALAEMANKKVFDDYRLIFDDAEAALEFNIKKLFGKKLDDRLENDEDDCSDTIQDFYGNVLNAIEDGEPFVYVLDSFDSLTSTEEQDRADGYAKKKEVKGSYKTEKPRMMSEILRVIARKIKKSNGLLIIISQTRDNIGITFGSKKTRSGGKALKFYSCHEIWLAVRRHKKKKDLEIGVDVIAKISKNKLTGKLRKIEFPIYYEIGVDNITSCINYLIEVKHWKKKGSTITAKEFDVATSTSKLVAHIEKNNLELRLSRITATVWNGIEDELKLNRKSKYA